MKRYIIISPPTVLAIVIGIAFSLCLTFAPGLYADQGATVDADGTFTDGMTGFDINLVFSADEAISDGVGRTTIFVTAASEHGPAIRGCSTHGSPVAGEGVFPLRNIQCGRAARMSVSIENCKAKIETHGYVHSDHPYVTYSGSTTIDLTLKKRKGDWLVNMKMHTPKKKVRLHGILTGNVLMSTCQ